MDDDKENSSLSQAAQLGGLTLQDTDILNISKILAECDTSTLELYTSELIDPESLGFVPKSAWSSKPTSLETLRDGYFGRKNNVNRRFEHKLWNALKITASFPNMTRFVGVSWVNDRIIKVYKYAFAKLLNIKIVDGGLFHKQGNFTRHGFVTVNEQAARSEVPESLLADVDFRDVVLIYHKDNRFTQNSPEEAISNCKWEDPSPKMRVASLKIGVMPSIDE
ncbi:hypothetical protein TRFO_12059 [Tritrichomonas foetus]|uniref:Initiator binding domain-containing protein n=1 Tax=Tritrichomonas foetus TaxID=1144522 RepID=A0A1J4J0W0_9EUKA|nr:hypothetical protein TRFO_12059 [Tritrichomonas foetus]|eukprot:OHS93050.1 hypothetical protein TRFO_12059 [Tritrichomonas foetus]